MISISLSPNLEKDDFKLALKMLFNPRSWILGNSEQLLTKRFSEIVGKDNFIYPINSGRSGLFLILKALNINKSSEIIIQALTCIVVPNAIRALGAIPVYADVDSSFNLDPRDFEKKITKHTKAVIVQHTFGIPANMDLIIKIAKKHNILVIEDCAHSLGVSHKGKPLGTIGDVAFYSFGRDKIISSVFGGMIITKDNVLSDKLDRLINQLEYNSRFFVFKQLLHPIVTYPAIKYYSKIGKFIFYLASKTKLLSRAVFEKEKIGIQPDIFPAKMPNALSVLAINQLDKLKRFNARRGKIVSLYKSGLKKTKLILPNIPNNSIMLRFPILSEKSSEILELFRKKKIYLGDWYRNIVMPESQDKYTGYKKGSCPNAEYYSQRMLNLPTNPTLTDNDVNMIVDLLQK